MNWKVLVETTDRASFTHYFLQELAVLEDDCAEFASLHPQIAGHLGLGSEGSADPHVRQLIESVAFIAARLKLQMDGVTGQVAHSLLQSVAPYLCLPVPSMSVACLSPISDQLAPSGSAPARDIRLRVTANGADCFFTGRMQDIQLWPLNVQCIGRGPLMLQSEQHKDTAPFVLEVRHASKNIPSQAPGELTFFVSGALPRALAAMDALSLGLVDAQMVALDGSWSVHIPRDKISIIGFDPSHRMMPVTHASSDGGSLAQEFLHFPRRFCFFKVAGLLAPKPCIGFYLVFSIRQNWLSALDAVSERILLNCVPIINLYQPAQLAVPLNDEDQEYPLPRQHAIRGGWDVLAVDSVNLIEHEKSIRIPEFQLGFGEAPKDGTVRWQSVRLDRARGHSGDSSLALRLIGMESANTSGRRFDMAMVQVQATHGHTPEKLTAGQVLDIVGWESGYRAALEFVPTPYVEPLRAIQGSTHDALRTLQVRSGRVTDLAAAVVGFLAAHDRAQTPHSLAMVSALSRIRREVVALPQPDAPLGAMLGMGCRYSLEFAKAEGFYGSRHLLSRVIGQIVSHMHDEQLPMEVVAPGPDGRAVHVF
jgi:type VI secretion system VasI/ImpG family protein